MCDSLSSTKVLLVIFKDNLKQGKRTKHISYFHNNKYDWLTLKKIVKRLILFSLIPNNRILPSDFKLLTEHTWISRDFSETNILQRIPKIRIKFMVTICSVFVFDRLCGLKKKVRNVARIKYGFVGLVVILFTLNTRYCEAICIPLNIIFETCLNTDKFPLERKKGIVVPIHKKDDKWNVKNYRPVSLLPIFCKISVNSVISVKFCKLLIYDAMHDFLSDNNLIYPNQSGFRSGDSCINQLLSINHEILNACDKGLKVLGIFLDIKDFKLHQNSINRDIINILRGFLRNRK